MERNDCLIIGAESIDSNTLNRCLYNLYSFAKAKATESVGSTSENYPNSPFYLDGYNNALTDHPVISKYALSQASSSTEGVVPRLYLGSPSIGSMDDSSTKTETATGVYKYTESEIQTFVPTVQSLFSEVRPCVYSSILGDDSSTATTGTSSVGSATNPTIKFTSYMLCGYTGISFGTITFKKTNGDVQENTLSLNISRDLINLDNVEKVKFFNISNGVNSGIRSVSENGDVVSDISSCNVTYISDDDVVISNITKNDDSETIRIDKSTGRILEEDEVRERGDYIELSNDEYALSFFVVFDLSQTVHSFDDGTWCFYVTTDASYAKNKLYNADSYARNNLKYKFLGFEAADDGYEDPYDDTHTFTINGSHVCHNAVTTARDAFNGCYNATFPLLSYFSTELKYADRMFKDCHHATFDSLPSEISLAKLKTAASMFENCTNAGFSKVHKISLPSSTQLKNMFAGCSNANFTSLSSLDVNGNCGCMFLNDYYATFENLVYLSGNIPVINSIFEGCSNATFDALEKIESTASSIVNANRMFFGNTLPTFNSLETLSIGTNGYNAVSMFEGCSSAGFANLTTIGNPINASAMFKDCAAEIATFSGIESFGSKITNGTSMFEGCLHLDMEINDNISTLITASNMFKDVNRIIINGNMNSVNIADGMFSDDWTAIVNGNMNSVTVGRNMFTYCGTAHVNGYMNSLVDADAMFDSVTDAYMKEISNTVTNMSNMFSNTQSCCVTNYRGSDSSRYCTAAFQNATSVAITGNIFAGKPYTMQSMFEDAGNVLLCNPSMSGNPDDEEHRYYTSSFKTNVSVIKPVNDDSTQNSYFHGGAVKASTAIDDSTALVTQFTSTGCAFTVYNYIDGHSHVKTVNENDYIYKYDGKPAKGLTGRSYLINKIDGETYTDWYIYQEIDGKMEEDSVYYRVSKLTAISEGQKFSIQMIPFSSTKPVQNVDVQITRDYSSGGKYKIIVYDQSRQIVLHTNIDSPNVNIGVNFTEGNSGLEPVVTISYNNVENAFIFHRKYITGTIYYVEEVDYENPPHTVYDEKAPSNGARVYQLYKDYESTQQYAYLIVAFKSDNTRRDFFLYKGKFFNADGRPTIVDMDVTQGDIYSVQTIFDGTDTTLTNPPPIVELGLVSTNEMGNSLLYTNSMFKNVISSSLLSGYDDVTPLSLVDTSSMFELDEKNENDPTFEHVGNIFKNMDRTVIRDASRMFRNRFFKNPYPFANVNTYSFRIPPRLEDAREMFSNTTINIADDAEIGFKLPSTLTKASSAFDGYSGGLIRFAYNTVGEVFVHDDIECDDMFRDCSFANTAANKYSVSLPTMKVPMFKGSDFSFGDITSIVDRSGIYYQYERGVFDFTLIGKFITEYATLDSLEDDISKWFDEGIYLASILCPENDKYRLQTNVYEVATISKANSADILSIPMYTNKFTGSSISELTNDRIGFMFNPSIAIAMAGVPTDVPVKIGYNLTQFDSASSNEALLAQIKENIDDNAYACYQSTTLDSLAKIESMEAPFAFAGLKNATMNNVSEIGGQAVNTTAMFYHMPKATFKNLKSISLSHNESVSTFKSSFIDIPNTVDYLGNYNDTFRDNLIASFENLESINVRSTYFKLYPTDKDNTLFVYVTDELKRGKCLNFRTRINDVERSVKMVLEAVNGKYVMYLYNNDTGERYTVTDAEGNVSISKLETGIDVTSFYPEIKYDFAELNRAFEDDEENYEFTTILTIKNMNEGVAEKDRVKYYTITYNSYNEPLFRQHSKYPTLEDAFGKLHTTFPITDAESSSYYYNTEHHNYGITLSNDETTDFYKFKLVNFSEKPIVALDTGVSIDNPYTDVVFREDKIDGVDYLIVSIPSTGRHYLYHTDTVGEDEELVGIIEEDPTYTPHEESASEEALTVTLTPKTAPYSRTFGKNKVYTIDFTQSDDYTYKFHIMERHSEDIVTFITDVQKSIRLDCIDVYEEDRDGSNVFIVNFYGSGINYVIYPNGDVDEEITFPIAIRYRMHLSVSDLEKFGSESTSFCTNMFKNCNKATFNNLKVISLGSRGSCAGMFSDCSEAVFKNLEILYLPTPPSYFKDDGVTVNTRYYPYITDRPSKWYSGMFRNVYYKNIDLSKLKLSNTNIHSIDNNLGLGTNGSELFKGLNGVNNIASAQDAYNLIKLPLEIGNKMYWSADGN